MFHSPHTFRWRLGPREANSWKVMGCAFFLYRSDFKRIGLFLQLWMKYPKGILKGPFKGSRNTKDVSNLQLRNLICDLLEGVAGYTNKEKNRCVSDFISSLWNCLFKTFGAALVCNSGCCSIFEEVLLNHLFHEKGRVLQRYFFFAICATFGLISLEFFMG